MTVDRWMPEVRRLVVANHGDVSPERLMQERVMLEHTRGTGSKMSGVACWVASCFGARVEGESADEVMDALLEKLRADLAARIRKQRLELERLEAAATAPLRVVTSAAVAPAPMPAPIDIAERRPR